MHSQTDVSSVRRPFQRHQAEGQLGVATPVHVHTPSAISQLANLGRVQQPHRPCFLPSVEWENSRTHATDIVVLAAGESWPKGPIQGLVRAHAV